MGRFNKNRLALLLTVCAAAGLYAQDVFRVDVRLVRVIASVRDTSGAPTAGLNKDDFLVFDNGVQQEITLFERHTSQPLSIALLIDTSGSTAKELKFETESVNRFLKAVFREGHPEDTVALYSFNWQVSRNVEYTRRLDALDRSLKRLKAEAGTALYDAIYLASEDIQDRPGRHVVVLVTDGGDTMSSKNYHEALRAAHAADAVLYSILVMPITNDAGRNIGGENALIGMSTSTGGRLFSPGLSGLDTAFDDILRDLRTQYLLGFYPKKVPPTKDPFHRLTIKTKSPNLRVLSRSGYYGVSEPSSRPAHAP